MATQFIKFEAQWCPPCRNYKKTFESVMAEHKATHKSIDIDNEPDAAEKYEIKALPTVIALKDGEVVGTKVGALSPDQLDKWVSGILKD